MDQSSTWRNEEWYLAFYMVTTTSNDCSRSDNGKCFFTVNKGTFYKVATSTCLSSHQKPLDVVFFARDLTDDVSTSMRVFISVRMLSLEFH